MSKYIPYPFFNEDVPVYIYFVFEKEKPAGNNGFLKVAGRDFVFEDGTKMKFWGTNFNGAGCFPEHDYAKTLAKRLAKLGLNLVRFHQLDSEWHTPNIFAFTKGGRVTNAHLDPESMDRLDYLVKCLKDEGIYVYLDMFTYRRFRSDEGVAAADLLGDAGKPYCNFSRRLIELQKELATELWCHENPYTGLKYCDEPAIVLAEIVNESDLFKHKPDCEDYIEPYRTEFAEMFKKWLEEKGIEKDLSAIPFFTSEDPDLLDFKVDLQASYYKEMMEHLHKIGVKIPITGTNWIARPDNYKTQLVTDFLDTHHYFYQFGCWGEFEKSCMNKSVTHEAKFYLNNGCTMAHPNMPTYVSEWDTPWPNEYRADSVLYSAAFGLFQGWSGFAIHTYSYSAKLERMNMLGKEISAEKIGNVPYRQGIFSAWNDPAKFGLFYHAALMTRRNDVKTGEDMRAFKVEDRNHWDTDSMILCNEGKVTVPGLGGNERLPEPERQDNGAYVCSDTGELYRNYKDHYGKIDTDRTKCAFGFLGENGEVAMKGMKVRSKTDFAVVAISSLTDEAIERSDNILLTAVGRAKNTDAKFYKEIMLDIGKPPVLIENIEAAIEIDTVYPDLKVWAISAEGYYIGTVPTEYKDGKMTIKIGEVSRSMYYLIVRN
ncbi:MAG: hypothetical protein IJY12_05125 [Clostridia bacterium]|nr:hypothetical protein [Clostridia bacterium]